MQFNALVLDMHPYVADEPFAREQGIFGRRLVAGAMVFSVGLGLVATNCRNAFSYGYDRLRFIGPVFIGDTLYTIKTDLAKGPKTSRWACAVQATRCSRTMASWCCIASTSRLSNTDHPQSLFSRTVFESNPDFPHQPGVS